MAKIIWVILQIFVHRNFAKCYKEKCRAIFESVLRVIVIFVAPSLIVGQRSARGNPGLDKWFLCSLVKKNLQLFLSRISAMVMSQIQLDFGELKGKMLKSTSSRKLQNLAARPHASDPSMLSLSNCLSKQN